MTETSTPPPGPVEKLAFSTAELAHALGLHPETIRRLEKRGLLHPVPGIRHRIFARAEIDRFLLSGAKA